jgi:Fe(3+) dicitrate transport protein
MSGFFTGRVGSHVLADLSLTYDFNDQLDVGATVKNITDKRYIGSLRQGVYVGPERSFDVGLRYRF